MTVLFPTDGLGAVTGEGVPSAFNTWGMERIERQGTPVKSSTSTSSQERRYCLSLEGIGYLEPNLEVSCRNRTFELLNFAKIFSPSIVGFLPRKKI